MKCLMLEQLSDRPIAANARGFPPESSILSVSEIGQQEWSLPRAFSTPIAVLREDALAHNLTVMAAWCRHRGVELFPHGKTTMAPALFARQLEHGATGMTAATPAQVRIMRSVGVQSIQLANQLVQPREAIWLATQIREDPGFAFSCWVDSVDGVSILEAAGAATGAVFDVLLEVGVAGGRTGSRSPSQRAEVVAAVQRSPHVRLIGVAGYEGSVAGNRRTESMAAVREYVSLIRSVAEELVAQRQVGHDRPVVLTAGGSMFFDVVAEELAAGWSEGLARVILRSGCYIAHDSGIFHRNSPLDGVNVRDPLRPALTVWGTVLSRPEADRAFLDVGRRDISFDQGLPVVLRRLPFAHDSAVALDSVTVSALNDQHTFLRLDPGQALEVGDRVELGISHPCTTFDKWRFVPLVDRNDTVCDVIETFF